MARRSFLFHAFSFRFLAVQAFRASQKQGMVLDLGDFFAKPHDCAECCESRIPNLESLFDLSSETWSHAQPTSYASEWADENLARDVSETQKTEASLLWVSDAGKGDMFPFRRHSNLLRIGVVGNSCTAGGEQENFTAQDSVWVEIFAEQLARSLCKDVALFNAAIGGGTSFDSFLDLDALLPRDLDVVLWEHGISDMGNNMSEFVVPLALRLANANPNAVVGFVSIDGTEADDLLVVQRELDQIGTPSFAVSMDKIRQIVANMSLNMYFPLNQHPTRVGHSFMGIAAARALLGLIFQQRTKPVEPPRFLTVGAKLVLTSCISSKFCGTLISGHKMGVAYLYSPSSGDGSADVRFSINCQNVDVPLSVPALLQNPCAIETLGFKLWGKLHSKRKDRKYGIPTPICGTSALNLGFNAVAPKTPGASLGLLGLNVLTSSVVMASGEKLQTHNFQVTFEQPFKSGIITAEPEPFILDDNHQPGLRNVHTFRLNLSGSPPSKEHPGHTLKARAKICYYGNATRQYLTRFYFLQ